MQGAMRMDATGLEWRVSLPEMRFSYRRFRDHQNRLEGAATCLVESLVVVWLVAGRGETVTDKRDLTRFERSANGYAGELRKYTRISDGAEVVYMVGQMREHIIAFKRGDDADWWEWGEVSPEKRRSATGRYDRVTSALRTKTFETLPITGEREN